MINFFQAATLLKRPTGLNTYGHKKFYTVNCVGRNHLEA
jgi:hypothetical protein